MNSTAQIAPRPRSATYLHPREGRHVCQAFCDERAGLYGLAHGHGQGPAAEVAAIAVLRPCARLGGSTRIGEEGSPVRVLARLAAAELHQLRCSQHAYPGMSSSLALLSARPSAIELALVGDCVAYGRDLDEECWVPILSGPPTWLGPLASVEPNYAELVPRPGLQILLASGDALAMLANESTRTLTADRLAALAMDRNEHRGFGLVFVDLSRAPIRAPR